MRRRDAAEFIARGMRSLDSARRTGDYVDADAVVRKLQRKLDAARDGSPIPRVREVRFKEGAKTDASEKKLVKQQAELAKLKGRK